MLTTKRTLFAAHKVWISRKLTSMLAETQPKTKFVTKAHCPPLLTDLKLPTSWSMHGQFEVMWGMKNPSNWSWDMPEKVLCSLRTLITDQSQTKLQLLLRMRVQSAEWRFWKISPMETRDIEEKPLLSTSCTSKAHFIIDRSQIYIVYSGCVETTRSDVSWKSLQQNSRHRRKGRLSSKKSTLIYWPIAIEDAAFQAHARKIRYTKFQKNPYNGNRDTVENGLCNTNKVPINIDRSQPILRPS
jgi:hypothetical protein